MGGLAYGFERTREGVGFDDAVRRACNPPLARQALEAEPPIGLLLPCNVVVREAPGGAVVVSIADPQAMFSLVDNSALATVASEAEMRLRRVLIALGARTEEARP